MTLDITLPALDLKYLFAPSSIAIVGASPTDWMRSAPIRSLAALGYEGDVYPVHPKYEEIDGHACYPTLSAIPEVPDAVMILTGPGPTPALIDEAASIGIRAAVVVSGGFSDADEAGAEAQVRIELAARSAGVALVGPNCQGVISFHDKSALYLLPVFPDYVPGDLALVSQSGAVTDALANNKRGVRWSHIASCGNEAVVDAAVLLDYLV